MDSTKRKEFLEMLAKFYEALPCSEESGIRTPEHNRDEGGAPDSAHVHGVAQDLVLDRETSPDVAILYAKRLGFLGIEWDERNRHLHLDMHPSRRHWWVRITADGVQVPLSLTIAAV